MEIKNKLLFKIEVKKKIDKFIKEFPFYFGINIIINLILVLLIIFSAVFVAVGLRAAVAESIYGLFAIATLLAIFKITLRGFSRNIRIFKNIKKGDYDFGIEDHEMDNAIEFIEDLPMGREEVERMRIALSFNKLFDVLETVRIITFENGWCDIDLVFKYKTENLFKEN